MSMKTWGEAVILSFEKNSGTSDLESLYSTVGIYRTLTRADLRITYRRPNYYHTVRRLTTSLCRNGMLRRVSRGVYCLTQDGRRYLAFLRQ
jgi:hypothetical protein